MHELAIARSVVALADRHAAGRRVTGIDLKVGHLRQVVPSSLAFAFEAVSRGTASEGAALRIEEVPAAGRCRACGKVTDLPAFPLSCAECGCTDLEMTSGDELMVDALEVDEPLAT